MYRLLGFLLRQIGVRERYFWYTLAIVVPLYVAATEQAFSFKDAFFDILVACLIVWLLAALVDGKHLAIVNRLGSNAQQASKKPHIDK